LYLKHKKKLGRPYSTLISLGFAVFAERSRRILIGWFGEKAAQISLSSNGSYLVLVDSFQKTEIGEKEEKEEEKKRKKKRKKRRKREKRRGKVRVDLLKFPKVHRIIVKVSECHRLVSIWRGQEALMEVLCQKNGALWLICMWGGSQDMSPIA